MAPRGNRASRIRAGVRSSCRSSSTTCDGRRGLRAAAVERSHGLVARGAGTGAFGVVGAALRGAWRPGPGDLRGRSLRDRKSTRLTPVTNAHIVCRLLLEKTKTKTN